MSVNHCIVRLVICWVAAVVAPVASSAQPLRFPDVERRHDVIALVAELPSGRVLGGVRTSLAGVTRYHPGSVFKLAIAVAGVRAGTLAPGDTFTCNGTLTSRGTEHRCWLEAGHGRLRLASAVAHSCNLFFRAAASRLSSASILEAAHDLGMLDSPVEITMNDTNLLGESFAVTPAEMLRTALRLASRGRLGGGLDLSAARYRPIYQGLRACVVSGTGRAAWSRRFTLAGKTGTAARPDSPRRRAGWFIGFAPFERPRYAIVVLHRKGMGSDAAAVARTILSTLL